MEIFKYFQTQRKDIKKFKVNKNLPEEDSSKFLYLRLKKKKEEDPNPFGINQMSFKDPMGNLIYSVDAKYDIENFDYNPENTDNMFGNEIDVYMESIGQKITEYLVNFDFVKDIMKDNGFELDIPKDMDPDIYKF